MQRKDEEEEEEEEISVRLNTHCWSFLKGKEVL